MTVHIVEEELRQAPMIVHIAEEELSQVLIYRITPGTTKICIKSIIIIKFIFISSILLMMRKNHGIENSAVFLVCITMWLLSVGREWQKERG